MTCETFTPRLTLPFLLTELRFNLFIVDNAAQELKIYFNKNDKSDTNAFWIVIFLLSQAV